MLLFVYGLLLFIIWIFVFHALGEWLVCLCTFCVVVGFFMLFLFCRVVISFDRFLFLYFFSLYLIYLEQYETNYMTVTSRILSIRHRNGRDLHWNFSPFKIIQ